MKSSFRRAALVSVVVATCAGASAQLVGLSSSFTLSVTGQSASGPLGTPVGGASYAHSASSTAMPFTHVSHAISDTATYTVDRTPLFIYPETGTAYSEAGITATLDGGSLSLLGTTNAWHTINVGYPFLGVTASAHAEFTGSFRVDEWVGFDLTMEFSGLYPHVIYPPQFALTADNGFSLSAADVGLPTASYISPGVFRWYDGSGYLAPGTYTLSCWTGGSSEFYPGGDSAMTSLRVNLTTSRVSESSAAAGLLAWGFAILVGLRHGRRRWDPHN